MGNSTATRLHGAAPRKPDHLRLVADLFGASAAARNGDPAAAKRQDELLVEHRDAIRVRTGYLIECVGRIRLPADYREPAVEKGIIRRRDRLLELAAMVGEYGRHGRWAEAERCYEDAERVATDLDHWLRGYQMAAHLAEEAAAAKRRAQQLGDARRDKASRRRDRNAVLVAKAREVREGYPGMRLTEVARALRRNRSIPEQYRHGVGIKQLTRILRAAGLT
jgi:hypothetical protein